MTRYFLSIALSAIVINASAQTIVKETSGNILLLNNNVETVIASTHDASSPAVIGQKVFYLQSSNTDDKSKIVAYDITTKQTADVITIGMKSEKGYVVKTAITKTLADAKDGVLYFTTRDTYMGNPTLLTWFYNVSNGTFSVFSDGKVDKLDDDGNVVVSFEKKGPKGSYVQRIHYNAEHKQVKTETGTY